MILAPSLADWELDPLLERDTAPVGDMPLSRVLIHCRPNIDTTSRIGST